MSIIVRMAIWLLKRAKLSLADHDALLTAIVDTSHALPFRDIIRVNGMNQIVIDGKTIDAEMERALMLSARSLKNNRAFKYIREQVDFRAVNEGLYKAHMTPESSLVATLFAKTAIWNLQQFDSFIDLLAGDAPSALNEEMAP